MSDKTRLEDVKRFYEILHSTRQNLMGGKKWGMNE